MPLTSATLATELENLVPTDVEADAIAALVAAFTAYFAEATVGGVPADEGALSGAASAMEGAMTGLSAPGAAAASIQAGITAFWGVVATSGALIWAGVVPAIVGVAPPATLAGIAAALTPVFASNTTSEADLPTAAQNIAAAIHGTQSGGLAALTPPPPGATVPVL